MIGDRVTVRRNPSAAELAQTWEAIFPEPGEYLVAKAMAPGAEFGEFENWFLRRLYDVTRERFVSAQYAIWETLDDLLHRRGVRVPSALDWWELNRTLFDITTASTARMVGLRVPPDLRERLASIGFAPPEILDFPGVAYRMGLIYDRLAERTPVEWSELSRLAGERPLGPAERAAVDFARTRAGQNLQPVFDATGRVWTAERELIPLRQITGRAVATRTQARAAARELSASQRARGIFRDAERVMRTELADARGHGAWKVRDFDAEQRVYRVPSRDACKACLRLYMLPSGMPRLYLASEVEAADALGYNRGPQADYHPRVGSTHPNCACGPWQKWLDAMEPIWRRTAPNMAEMMERIKVWKDAA